MSYDDNYFIDDDYAESNADNFEGEDGILYYYSDGQPFAEINGKFYVGGHGEMHSDCAAMAAYDEFAQSAEQELYDLESQREALEYDIKEAEENDEDISDLEYELNDTNERIEHTQEGLDMSHEEYWQQYLEDYERESWVESLGDCGRFWEDGNSGVIACWSTPSVSHLQEVINQLNQWSQENMSKPIDFNNYKIAVGGTGVGWGNHKVAKLIPVSKYAEEVKFRNLVYQQEHPNGQEEPSKVRQQIQIDKAIHNLPPEEKWRATAQSRDTVAHKIGKKLTMSNGKEMTMAQYNALRHPYGENTKKLNSIISESINHFVLKEVRATDKWDFMKELCNLLNGYGVEAEVKTPYVYTYNTSIIADDNAVELAHNNERLEKLMTKHYLLFQHCHEQGKIEIIFSTSHIGYKSPYDLIEFTISDEENRELERHRPDVGDTAQLYPQNDGEFSLSDDIY